MLAISAPTLNEVSAHSLKRAVSRIYLSRVGSNTVSLGKWAHFEDEKLKRTRDGTRVKKRATETSARNAVRLSTDAREDMQARRRDRKSVV